MLRQASISFLAFCYHLTRALLKSLQIPVLAGRLIRYPNLAPRKYEIPAFTQALYLVLC